MGSELSGGGADRPGKSDRGDRPREGDPYGELGPDLNPVPASADHRSPGMTRREAYTAVGQGDQLLSLGLVAGTGDRGRGSGGRDDGGRATGDRDDGRGAAGDGGGSADRRSGDGEGDDGSRDDEGGDDGGGGDRGDRGARHPIRRVTSTFHDQTIVMYTDGVDWASREAVRAAGVTDRQGGQSTAPRRLGIPGLPHQRDLGDNTLGENPDVHLGDTTDQRTFADKVRGEAPFSQNLGEKDDPSESRIGRAFDSFLEDADDGYDASGSVGAAIADIVPRGPEPTGVHTLASGHSTYDAAPTLGLNVSDVVGSTVLMMVAAITGLRHLASHSRRDR
ncbi:MAG: hypothetical protein J2P25_01670 [Nocardiopsaceae bacterium]|nr:hypothetical protein [Nocardiopsaceae bacterium]